MSQRNYFGTDGIRGKVGLSNINPEFVLKLGWALGRVLANGQRKKLLSVRTRVYLVTCWNQHWKQACLQPESMSVY